VVLGEAEPAPDAVLDYRPPEAAVYVLLQEVHTPDGIIYDFTLPQVSPSAPPAVLGEEPAPSTLTFPINEVAGAGAPDTRPRPVTLGDESPIGGALGGAVAEVVTKRVLQVLRSPIDAALLATVRHFEGEPQVLAHRNGAWSPLAGAEPWRALLQPGREQRVLLYVHGFGSSTEGSGGGLFVPELAAGYDAILGYDHPTVGHTPLENALALLERIPDDLQLSVDLVAHSRGGLVVRSLVELIDWQPKLRPFRLVTAGSPHAGTRLAEPDRWDRLVSMGMTLGSWLGTLGGVPFWAPKLLEFVLKAAVQGIFDLPGVGAMTPGGEFLRKLNAADAPGLDDRVQYAALNSSFAISSVLQQGFRQAFTALVAQTFMGEANDLVVPTASAIEIDKSSRTLAEGQRFQVAVDHGSYFQDPPAAAFIKRHLLAG
jgi:hypothetical protein